MESVKSEKSDTRQIMTRHANHRTTVSSLMGSPIIDAQGSTFGHVSEFAVAPSIDSAHVHGLVLKSASKKLSASPSLVLITDLHLNSDGAMQLRDTAHPTPFPQDETYLLLERDLLDQQIIDVHGIKWSESTM